MKAYCVKCKAPADIAGAVDTVLKNGRKAIKGKCSDCGTGMVKILGGKAKKPETKPAPAAAESRSYGWTFFHE